MARLSQRLDDTRSELGLTPARVERVVRTGLDLARQAPLSPRPARPSGRRPAPGRPRVRPRPAHRQLGRTVMDLPDPLEPEKIRPITFDHEVASGGADDVVLAHLGHPLVGQAMRLLRSRIWSNEQGLSRVTAKIVPDSELAQLVAVVHARLVITGRGGHRLHEEVIAAGGRVSAGRFSREGYGVAELARALAAATDRLPPAHVREQLAQAWPALEEGARAALTARANQRAESLARTLATRVEDDVKTMRQVLNELRTTITRELEELEEPEQLMLFEPSERQQFSRDVDALRARVESIPAEIEAEEAAIRSRYSEQATRIFPLPSPSSCRRLADSGLSAVLGLGGRR